MESVQSRESPTSLQLTLENKKLLEATNEYVKDLAKVFDGKSDVIGFAYAITLGFALVHLGEHYVVDLLAGGALTLAVRRLERPAGPLLGSASRAVAAVEAVAHA